MKKYGAPSIACSTTARHVDLRINKLLIYERNTWIISVWGVWPGFLKCGACELTFASEKGACERKISKFGGL